LPNEILSEAGMICPNLNKTWTKEYNGLILQIFHSTFKFENEVFNDLRKLYNINNSNSNSPHDFLYFLKVRVGSQTGQSVYEARSNLIQVTKYEKGVIYLE